MALHNERGRVGEELAAKYLQERGYTLRHTNWRYRRLELDIVAEREGILAFVEVKTRLSKRYERAEDAVNLGKIERLVEAAEAYIYQFDVQLEPRFDVIAVYLAGQTPEVEHIVDAFYPPL